MKRFLVGLLALSIIATSAFILGDSIHSINEALRTERYYNGCFIYYKEDTRIRLDGQINIYSIKPIINQIGIAGQNIVLTINSPGGQLVAATALIGAMEASNKKITCIVEYAASAALFVFSACNERYIKYSGAISFHRAIRPYPAGYMNSTYLRKEGDSIYKEEEPHINRILKNSSLTYEDMDSLAEHNIYLFSYEVEQIKFAKVMYWIEER